MTFLLYESQVYKTELSAFQGWFTTAAAATSSAVIKFSPSDAAAVVGRTQFFQLHKLTHTEVQASHPTRTEVQVGLSSIQAAASSAVI